MKWLKLFAAAMVIVLLTGAGWYFSMLSTASTGQPRLIRFGSKRVLVETVPPREAGFWSQPIYAEYSRNGQLKRMVAGHTVRVGRVNFYMVGR